MKRVRVIKLDGSLLTMKDLRTKFHRWCRENPHPLTLIVVGGGGVTEAIRSINKANKLTEDFGYWICMDLLQQTAQVAHAILGDVDLYETIDDLQQPFSGKKADSTTPIIAIVQIGICFGRSYPNLGLPSRWDVTTDTIAAAFSQMYAAEELVMMKPIDVPTDYEELEELAAAGFVDSYFPEIAWEPKVRFVNLKAF